MANVTSIRDDILLHGLNFIEIVFELYRNQSELIYFCMAWTLDRNSFCKIAAKARGILFNQGLKELLVFKFHETELETIKVKVLSLSLIFLFCHSKDIDITGTACASQGVCLTSSLSRYCFASSSPWKSGWNCIKVDDIRQKWMKMDKSRWFWTKFRHNWIEIDKSGWDWKKTIDEITNYNLQWTLWNALLVNLY